MNILTLTLTITLTVTLTVSSLSATQLASMGRSRTSNDVIGDKWTQSDMEIWEEFGRWRRSNPRNGRPDNRDYDNERERERERERDNRRWNDDRDRRGRDPRNRPDEHDKDRNTGKPYPPIDIIPPSRQPPSVPEPERPVLNPLPIIIEPIRPMPSIIEPYPVIETTIDVGYPVTSTMEEGHSHYSQTTDYYSSNTGTGIVSASSIYYPSSTAVDSYTSKVAVVSKKYTPIFNTTSTSMSYGSTSIVTVPESTVTTKVTGRYRAMSNSAAGVGNNVAGSISFGLVLFSSLFLLILV